MKSSEYNHADYAQAMQEHRLPCEYRLSVEPGFMRGDYCGCVPARWFVKIPDEKFMESLEHPQMICGLWVCAEHYDKLMAEGWVEI